MPKRIFEFKCANNHISEALTEPDKDEIECTTCGLASSRIISTPRIVNKGYDPSMTTAYDKWDRMHRQATAVARKKSYYEPTHS